MIERENILQKQYGTKKKAEAYDPWTKKDKKNYKAEVKKILRLISKYKKSKSENLLDIGCGTGSHLLYLRRNFNCTGIDLSNQMLKIAKMKVKGVRFKQADMTNFKFEEKFDIIISLFSVILYSSTYSNFKKTVKNMYNHLEIGGILILEPFFQKTKNEKVQKYYLYNEPKKWLKIMKSIGFEVKFLKNVWLDNPKKGLYVAIKKRVDK